MSLVPERGQIAQREEMVKIANIPPSEGQVDWLEYESHDYERQLYLTLPPPDRAKRALLDAA